MTKKAKEWLLMIAILGAAGAVSAIFDVGGRQKCERNNYERSGSRDQAWASCTLPPGIP
jgi:hypothetical protein